MSELISNYVIKNYSLPFSYKIYIRNETSHTLFSRPDELRLRELKDNGLVVELPKNICQKGHALTLFFVESTVELGSRVSDSGPLKEAVFTALVKVNAIEPDENSVSAELIFSQHDSEHWKNIIQFFSDKQERTTKKIMQQHLVRDEE